jgi:two-component system sensor histidine kinase PilS (NtrC family)
LNVVCCGRSSIGSIEEDLKAVQANADVGQLRQVIINLLRNAASAVKTGGRIRVRTMEIDGRARIDVWDSAGAVADDDRERIFEPFFTRSQSGTGLGLSTVRSIVHAHGGQVWVTSSPSEGTTFSVLLPAPSR